MPPQWGFGGILAAGGVRADDVAVAASEIRASGVRTIVKPGPLTAALWASVPAPVRVPHTVHIIELTDGFDDFWSTRLSSGVRYKIRRAEREGVEVEWDATGRLIPVAWDIHLRWAANRASRMGVRTILGVASPKTGVHGGVRLSQFQAVARMLGERCRVGVASVDGEAVAYVIMLIVGQHAHYWRTASDQTLTRSRYPNQLLLARLIEEAAAAGCRFVHLGESGGVRTLEQFKESLGAEPRSYDELRFERRITTGAVHARAWTRALGTRAVVGGVHRLKRLRRAV